MISLKLKEAYKNLDFIQEFYPGLNEEDLLLCDPQTSGGLLISIEEKKKALRKLQIDAKEMINDISH